MWSSACVLARLSAEDCTTHGLEAQQVCRRFDFFMSAPRLFPDSADSLQQQASKCPSACVDLSDCVSCTTKNPVCLWNPEIGYGGLLSHATLRSCAGTRVRIILSACPAHPALRLYGNSRAGLLADVHITTSGDRISIQTADALAPLLSNVQSVRRQRQHARPVALYWLPRLLLPDAPVLL